MSMCVSMAKKDEYVRTPTRVCWGLMLMHISNKPRLGEQTDSFSE